MISLAIPRPWRSGIHWPIFFFQKNWRFCIFSTTTKKCQVYIGISILVIPDHIFLLPILLSGLASQWRVYYQRGLPHHLFLHQYFFWFFWICLTICKCQLIHWSLLFGNCFSKTYDKFSDYIIFMFCAFPRNLEPAFKLNTSKLVSQDIDIFSILSIF